MKIKSKATPLFFLQRLSPKSHAHRPVTVPAGAPVTPPGLFGVYLRNPVIPNGGRIGLAWINGIVRCRDCSGTTN